VEAVASVRDTSVIVKLAGRLSAPVPSFSSDPPLSQDEVLALLLFGRPLEELSSSQAGSAEGMAAGMAAGVLFQELGGEELGGFLPVDTFDVGLGGSDEGPSVEVGKYLTDRLFVSVGQSTGKRATTHSRAELSLTRHWSVLTELSSDTSAGADIEWSLEY
jgi:translocation and assembly module TamB